MSNFIPPNSLSLDVKPKQQRRIAIQGFSGVGKTTSAITARNPVVLDIDNSVDEINCRAAGKNLNEVIVVPFYSRAFLDTVKPRTNIRDAFIKWLEDNINKFSEEQTLVLDSWSRLQDSFDQQTTLEPVISKRGEVDAFAFWALKQQYSRDVLSIIRTAKCDVIVIMHEIQETDDNGKPTGKVMPLMSGKFVNKLGSYFTDFYRQIAIDKECTEALATKLGLTIQQLKSYCDSCKTNTLRLWQIESSSIANCKSKLLDMPRFIPANCSVFYK